MTTLREWREKRPSYALIETLKFSHSSFGSYLVAKDQFLNVTLGGETYIPASFSTAEAPQDGTASISMTVTFLTGAEALRSMMKLWRGNSRMEPIACEYAVWQRSGDAIALNDYSLFVKDVSVDGTNVTLTLSLTNPLTLGSSIVYRVSDYPGLKTV